jgi:hypothetical protein
LQVESVALRDTGINDKLQFRNMKSQMCAYPRMDQFWLLEEDVEPKRPDPSSGTTSLDLLLHAGKIVQ